MSLTGISVRVAVGSAFAIACASTPPSPAGTWRHPPSHTEEMWLIICPNGRLEFSGGFLFYNPGFWFYDSENEELRITLGGRTPLGGPFEYQQEHRPQTLRGFDEASRTLVYPFDSSTEHLDFGGHVFFREVNPQVALRLTSRCN